MIEIDEKELAVLIAKAKGYEEIELGISEFYDEGNEDSDQGLDDIGEYIASYFGWL